jgi:hypothetical protein
MARPEAKSSGVKVSRQIRHTGALDAGRAPLRVELEAVSISPLLGALLPGRMPASTSDPVGQLLLLVRPLLLSETTASVAGAVSESESGLCGSLADDASSAPSSEGAGRHERKNAKARWVSEPLSLICSLVAVSFSFPAQWWALRVIGSFYKFGGIATNEGSLDNVR